LKSYLPDSIGAFRKIIQRKNGELLFLSTFKGVYNFNGKTFSNLTRSLGIENDTIVSLMEDRSGNLWMGRTSEMMSNGGKGGVWFYDGTKVKLFTTKDGLSHNCVFTIVEDKSGFVWFGTRNTGLCRFDGKVFTDFTE
jgi:ligand-binding sensor domain-containing protein